MNAISGFWLIMMGSCLMGFGTMFCVRRAHISPDIILDYGGRVSRIIFASHGLGLVLLELSIEVSKLRVLRLFTKWSG